MEEEIRKVNKFLDYMVESGLGQNTANTMGV